MRSKSKRYNERRSVSSLFFTVDVGVHARHGKLRKKTGTKGGGWVYPVFIRDAKWKSRLMLGSRLEILVEVMCMCMYSVTARNSRDARQGEDLTITRAPHGGSNWLTEAGKSDVAVCVPNTAALAVQRPNQSVRGAWFEQARQPDEQGNRDFLNYLDGEKERVALNDLPRLTKIRVLRLFSNTRPALAIPATVNSESGAELVGAGVSGGNRRGVFSRLFGSSD